MFIQICFWNNSFFQFIHCFYSSESSFSGKRVFSTSFQSFPRFLHSQKRSTPLSTTNSARRAPPKTVVRKIVFLRSQVWRNEPRIDAIWFADNLQLNSAHMFTYGWLPNERDCTKLTGYKVWICLLYILYFILNVKINNKWKNQNDIIGNLQYKVHVDGNQWDLI